MHPSTLAKRLQFAIFVGFIVFYFYGLGHFPLVGPDEPRYAQVAREMLEKRDLITPTLGGHTWFEKPALLYWMLIAAFRTFGVNEWSARLGPAVCGLLTIAAVWFLSRTLERETVTPNLEGLSWWSVLLTASCLGLIVFSRATSFDIVITMTTTWALCFFIRRELITDRARKQGFLIGFYCFVGLSLIAKGLVGIVIPFGVVGCYFLLRRAWPSRTLWLSLFWGLPLSLIVSAVWYGPVIYKHGWHFIDEFFIQHHFARYISNKYHHPQPLYFYPAILLMLSVPWTPFLVDAFISARNWNWRSADSENRIQVFSFAWIVFPILFFSFSSSKLPGYILPVLPAALILASVKITRYIDGNGSSWSMTLTGLLCSIMGVAGLVYGLRVEQLSVITSLLIAAPFLLAGLFAMIWHQKRVQATFGICGAVLLTVVMILNCAAPQISRRESTRDLLLLADSRGYSGLPVLALHGDDRSAEFYASGRVIYGANGEVTALDEAPLILAEARKRKEKVLAFIPAENLGLFTGKPGIEVVGDNGKLALLCLY